MTANRGLGADLELPASVTSRSAQASADLPLSEDDLSGVPRPHTTVEEDR